MPESNLSSLLSNADAVVVGSGPNGLAGAIRLAQAGKRVLVLERAEIAGGGVRSSALTLPGFVHDVCSSVYPMAVCSPFFRTLPLQEHRLRWIVPPAALAHPFDDGSAAVLYSSVSETAATLGQDGKGYLALVGDLVSLWEDLLADALAPLRFPRHPLLFARFGARALRSVSSISHSYFRSDRARAFFAGIGGHSMLPLEKLTSAAAALVLAVTGHAAGWPIVQGGAQNLANALLNCLHALGGAVQTGFEVESLAQLAKLPTVLLDITPRQLLRLAGECLPAAYRRKLEHYRYGMGVFKVDWALSRPIPWKAAACRQAGTIHLGGSFEEISRSERMAWRGEISDRPFVLLTQPSLFDSSRAPAGRHTAWGYCHVPHGFSGSMLDSIERQVERFAPGFRDCILARSVMTPADLQAHNPNLIGGDIGGGAPLASQLFFRPTAALYRTPLRGAYLCSSSTPPGPGVHGMCGFFAAEWALRQK